jgi:hypothetical protein
LSIFSDVFVPVTELAELERRKDLLLDDVSRAKLKIKLATFLGRPTDKEDAAGLRDRGRNPPRRLGNKTPELAPNER